MASKKEYRMSMSKLHKNKIQLISDFYKNGKKFMKRYICKDYKTTGNGKIP